jgi:hypothetical protein
MYCPNCGQEQISDEMRFCQRCGLSLTDVKNLISRAALVVPTAEVQPVQRTRGQRSTSRGAWMMLVSLVLAFIAGFFTVMDDDFGVLFLFPVLLFLIGFIVLLYGVFLADRKAQAKRAATQISTSPSQLVAPARTPELYAAPAQPIENFRPHRVETAEMVQPRSVTENTTRLLDDDAERRR